MACVGVMAEGEERLRDDVESAVDEYGPAAAIACARATSFESGLLRKKEEFGREFLW